MKFEYPVLVLLATAGMLMMISANDLISLYVGLELQSLALYVLAAIRRDDQRSSEAGLKYFVLGALSSGMLLYGASLIYGFTGSTSFAAIAAAAALPGAGENLGLIIGLVFLLVGLAFKVSAVPFHMWTPDVYEGAPTPVTAFFAAAPKVAAMALLMRVTLDGLRRRQAAVAAGDHGAWRSPPWCSAPSPPSARPTSSGCSPTPPSATSATRSSASPRHHRRARAACVIYLVIYVAMTLGAFACVLAMRRGQTA